MIEIREVVRAYGETRAVRGVSLSIGRGEVVGLLGHNGAGKTTLMKMLTGYLEPTSGSIRVGDHDVVSDRAAAQRLIGYLPENAPLYPEMLVQDYLLLLAELRGVAADQRVRAAGRAAAATGLGGFLTRPIATLSKGYRQRVGIAQAIVHDPAVLVLDEPTNGLDPVQIQSIRELIRRLAKKTTILLSTHILQEVEAVCERVLVMIDGSLAADAPISTLLATGSIRVALRGATGVPEALGALAGVKAVRKLGQDPVLAGFEAFAVDAPPTVAPSVAALASKHGWEVGSLTPEHQTLDAVFRRLQSDHAARQEAR
jgi:ABC-2 type transport system ATP-binding protein